MGKAFKAFSLAVLLSAAACAPQNGYEGPPRLQPPPGPPPAPHGRATEMQIEQAMDRYSSMLQAKNADGMAAMYTPDGVMERQSGGPLHGRDEIRAFLSSFPNVRVLANQMTTISLAYNGPAVVQTGEFHQSARANGKVVNASGRFEATWVRGPHGDWYIKHMATRPNAN